MGGECGEWWLQGIKDHKIGNLNEINIRKQGIGTCSSVLHPSVSQAKDKQSNDLGVPFSNQSSKRHFIKHLSYTLSYYS